MCTYKYLTHYDALYIVFNFTFTTAFYSLSWLAWVSVRLRGWQQSESRVTPHNVINTKQMGERKQLLGKMSVPAFHCNGFTAIIFAGVFGLSVAKSASYRQQSTKNFFFSQPFEWTPIYKPFTMSLGWSEAMFYDPEFVRREDTGLFFSSKIKGEEEWMRNTQGEQF